MARIRCVLLIAEYKLSLTRAQVEREPCDISGYYLSASSPISIVHALAERQINVLITNGHLTPA